MRSWKRAGDDELEARLRAERPEPTPEVSPRHTGFKRGLHVPLGLAGGLSVVVLTVAIALGGGSDPVELQNVQTQVPAAPTGDQYEKNVTICMGGQTLRVTKSEADRLIAAGLATKGPCKKKPR